MAALQQSLKNTEGQRPPLHRHTAALPCPPSFWLQELTAARMESHKAQTALMQRDAELERRNVEIASLQSDKAGLDKLLQVGLGAVGGRQAVGRQAGRRSPECLSRGGFEAGYPLCRFLLSVPPGLNCVCVTAAPLLLPPVRAGEAA